jgi:hypothetical protein
MLLQLFKGTSRIVLLLIIIVSAGVWISAILKPEVRLFSHSDYPMPLYRILIEITGNNSVLNSVVSFILLLTVAGLLVSFNTSVFFINERTFLPALIFILLIGIFPDYQVNNPVTPASLFLVLALRRITDGYKKEGTAFNFFDAALFIGAGSLFYANLLWFGLLIFVGIAILRTISLKEIAVSLTGLITPFFITAGIYYLSGKGIGSFLSEITNNLSGHAGNYLFGRMTLITVLFTGAVNLISIFYLYSVIGTKKIKSRKTYTLLLWTFIITIVLYFADPSVSVEINWLCAVPASYFMTHYFVFRKNRIIKELLFGGFFILIIVVQVIYTGS